jgi:type VI protein secretion system component VasK
MVIYGAMFLLIPLVRYLWQTALNHSIKIRNYERHEAAKVVSQPDREVKQKLMERQEFINAAAIREVQADKLAFSTESESLDQQFKELELTSSDNQKPNAALEMIVQNMNETVLRKDESAGYSAESMDPGNEINRDESNRDESNRDSQ